MTLLYLPDLTLPGERWQLPISRRCRVPGRADWCPLLAQELERRWRLNWLFICRQTSPADMLRRQLLQASLLMVSGLKEAGSLTLTSKCNPRLDQITDIRWRDIDFHISHTGRDYQETRWALKNCCRLSKLINLSLSLEISIVNTLGRRSETFLGNISWEISSRSPLKRLRYFYSLRHFLSTLVIVITW